MSDSEGSAVTYTSVYTDFEPWRFQWVSDEKAPPSLDYVPGPEHPPSPIYVAYVPEPEYPEYLVSFDDEDGPVDYPMDGGDDNDDDSSGDDVDDEDEPKEEEYEDEEEEEEHTPPPVISEAEAERLLVLPLPSSSPLVSLSSPSAEECLARCFASPATSSPPSGSLTQTQSLRVASTQALMDVVNAALPPPPPVPSSPLPPLPPSLYIPPVDRRADRPKIELPPCKRLCTMSTPIHRQRGIAEVGYGIREAWVHPIEVVPVVEPVTLGGVNDKVTK
ncbi:hypothetical protein Tco_0469644, partial [Tanacetum coccineum]